MTQVHPEFNYRHRRAFNGAWVLRMCTKSRISYKSRAMSMRNYRVRPANEAYYTSLSLLQHLHSCMASSRVSPARLCQLRNHEYPASLLHWIQQWSSTVSLSHCRADLTPSRLGRRGSDSDMHMHAHRPATLASEAPNKELTGASPLTVYQVGTQNQELDTHRHTNLLTLEHTHTQL